MRRESVIESCARAAHEVNRAYCLALGDLSQLPWGTAPEWQRESARSGVRAVIAGGPEHSPEKSHEGWLAQKLAEGWTYGPVKDPEAKTHPCCVPYSELPLAQRAKDYIFIAVVRQTVLSLVDDATMTALKRLLDYSWKDIRFRYEDLTERERELVTPEQFDELIYWVQS